MVTIRVSVGVDLKKLTARSARNGGREKQKTQAVLQRREEGWGPEEEGHRELERLPRQECVHASSGYGWQKCRLDGYTSICTWAGYPLVARSGPGRDAWLGLGLARARTTATSRVTVRAMAEL